MKTRQANSIHALVAVALIGLGAGLSACSTPVKIVSTNPALKIPAEEFRQRISTLCIRSIVSEIELEDAESKLEKMEKMLADELRLLGFDVVGSADLTEVWDQVREAEGGFYDIHWGTVVEARRDAIREKFFEDSARQLDCDAIVETEIVQVESALWNQRAKWDHKTAFLSYYVRGYISAISLRIVLIDLDGNELYYGVGGIHLAGKVEEDEFTNPHFESISKERFLSMQSENKTALRSVLHDLRYRLEAESP